jgi:branched-chain amino acid aminotransferase
MPAPLAFLNGRFVPAAELVLSAADAGFVFAATATDFCRTYAGRPFRWPDHLARLRRDCAALGIPLPYPDAELTAAAERLVAHNADGGELALVTFATPGTLGYLLGVSDDGPPTVGMHTFPLPLHRYRRFFTDGVTLAVAGSAPDGIVPAFVKHRSRLHWWLAGRAVSEPGAVPVLLGPDDAPDTAIGSVLAVAGGTVIRPEPGTGLEGVSLQVVGELCEKLGLRFVTGRIDLRDSGVSEVLLTGSGFGVAGVRRVLGPAGERGFAWPGRVVKRLLAAWSELVGVDVEAQMTGGPP